MLLNTTKRHSVQTKVQKSLIERLKSRIRKKMIQRDFYFLRLMVRSLFLAGIPEFNLRHAMVLPGHETYYKLKPNGVDLIDVDVLSTISGTVDATNTANCNGDLSKAGVYAYNSTADVTTLQGIDYDTDHNGPVLSTLVSHDVTTDVYSYQINYVEAGSYKLALVCNASDDFLTEAGNASGYALVVADPIKDVQVQDPAVSGTTTVTENF